MKLSNENQRTRFPINKTNPGREGTFIALPSDARHYVYHPKMTPAKLYTYAILIDLFNENKGYAFPSQESLAFYINVSPTTINTHIRDLKAVGLLYVPIRNQYIPLQPLSQEEFFEDFPEAKKVYLEKLKFRDSRQNDAAMRLKEYRESGIKL